MAEISSWVLSIHKKKGQQNTPSFVFFSLNEQFITSTEFLFRKFRTFQKFLLQFLQDFDILLLYWPFWTYFGTSRGKAVIENRKFKNVAYVFRFSSFCPHLAKHGGRRGGPSSGQGGVDTSHLNNARPKWKIFARHEAPGWKPFPKSTQNDTFTCQNCPKVSAESNKSTHLGGGLLALRGIDPDPPWRVGNPHRSRRSGTEPGYTEIE